MSQFDYDDETEVQVKAEEATKANQAEMPREAAQKTEKEIRLARKADRKNEQIKNLLAQLHELKVTMKELVDRYQAVISGQLSGIILVLEDSQHSLKTSLKLKTNAIRSMSEKIQDLKLKPKKGKSKDLKRIEEIVESFAKAIGEIPTAQS